MFAFRGEVPRLVAVEGLIEDDGRYGHNLEFMVHDRWTHRSTLIRVFLKIIFKTSQPIYRHPADESPPLLPFSPTVQKIRACVEKALGHPLNHVLIQHYRHGGDYISEHSDKTIDVVRDSKIVNVSLGAQRTMTLRTKKDAAKETKSDRETQRVPLFHNSCL